MVVLSPTPGLPALSSVAFDQEVLVHPVIRTPHILLRTTVDAIVMALCVVAAWYLVVPLVGAILGRGDSDAEIAGMWSVAAAVFVFSDPVRASAHSFTGRMTATLVSSLLCLAYLLILPVEPWGTALVIGAGALVLAALGLRQETVTTSITSAVVLVVAGIDGSAKAWEDPLLRIGATVVGGLVALAAAWVLNRLSWRRGVVPR